MLSGPQETVLVSPSSESNFKKFEVRLHRTQVRKKILNTSQRSLRGTAHTNPVDLKPTKSLNFPRFKDIQCTALDPNFVGLKRKKNVECDLTEKEPFVKRQRSKSRTFLNPTPRKGVSRAPVSGNKREREFTKEEQDIKKLQSLYKTKTITGLSLQSQTRYCFSNGQSGAEKTRAVNVADRLCLAITELVKQLTFTKFFASCAFRLDLSSLYQPDSPLTQQCQAMLRMAFHGGDIAGENFSSKLVNLVFFGKSHILFTRVKWAKGKDFMKLFDGQKVLGKKLLNSLLPFSESRWWFSANLEAGLKILR
jgi:hypothetical protein